MADMLLIRSGCARWRGRSPRARGAILALLLGIALGGAGPDAAAAVEVSPSFEKDVQPLLSTYCFDCHGDGMNKGNVSFDDAKSSEELLSRKELWLAVLKNVRAGLMPPEKKPRPGVEERRVLETWIERTVFELDPNDPDPGRVTVRRLNRAEYRNTIRDLMGVDFDTEREFPPDDTGHGFDNISDVLTLSPMLIEKYLAAARSIVDQAVPVVSKVPPERVIPGSRFSAGATNSPSISAEPGRRDAGRSLSYYQAGSVSNVVTVAHAGRYKLLLELSANERFVDSQFDYNKCRLTFSTDGEELLRQDFVREGGKRYTFEFDRDWQPGEHVLVFSVTPLTPEQKQVRSLTLRIDNVTVRGPDSRQHWVRPKNYERLFGGTPPESPARYRAHALRTLQRFATQAYRRPVDARTAERLVGVAEAVYSQPGKTYEEGIAQAMVATLASPRFLFREESVAAPRAKGLQGSRPGKAMRTQASRYEWVDEYSLASRLSYFLWSSMPDEELRRLADQGKLRLNLDAQYQRMLADPRSDALIRNFVGQWLQARDIETVPIEARAVMAREVEPDPDQERARRRFRELRERPPESLSAAEKEELAKARNLFFRGFNRFNRFELTGALRQDMRRETEKSFEHVLREDRSLLELLDADYVFVNQRLAEQYGLPAVEGDELRRVALPPDSPRGGVLTQGTILAVTSNPTRTSPVKRGLFILENIFGTPPPPPPPDIPALEDAAKKAEGREPTLRETLALHREQALCSSCHNRMDPLGLAFENFNALGRWRDKERSQPVETSGRLITGEAFANVKELKRILVQQRSEDYYRCLTEKLLTYALGRGLEYYDLLTVDGIVARLRADGGRPSTLLRGIIESAPFQKRRPGVEPATPGASAPSGRHGTRP